VNWIYVTYVRDDIDRNEIGNKGVISIGEGLKNNGSLTRLQLSNE
jgi:hypothetical protein